MHKNEIPISEIFHSIQGEGPKIGHPTVFVRVFGCNMKPVCPWCDSMYAVQKEDDTVKIVPIEDVVNEILKYSCGDITFTGGEPLLYIDQIKQIMGLLSLTGNFTFNFETNGMIWPGDIEDYNITYIISPKFHAMDLNVTEETIGEYIGKLKVWHQVERHPVYFKYVYEGQETIDNIKKLESLLQFNFKQMPYLMPEGKFFDQDKYKELAQVCLDNNWIMSSRLHTIIWGNKRGV